MGVFKWLRRERTPGSTTQHSRSSSADNGSLRRHASNDPLRDEEYDRALYEFFARRSIDAGFSVNINNDEGARRSTGVDEERNHQSLPCVEYRTELSFPGSRGPKAARRHSGIPSERNGSSRQSTSDSQRDDEYEKALNEYFARRSNDTIFRNGERHENFIDPSQIFSTSQASQSLPFLEQKTEVSLSGEWPRSESRKDRKEHKQRADRIVNVPQIQFLFSNQVFMPGSGSFVSPHKNSERNARVDFDECEPPSEFFTPKKSSRPFEEKYPERKVKDDIHRRSFTPPLRERLVSESQQDLLSGSDATADDIDSGVSAAGCGPADRQLNDILQEWKSLDDWADEQLRINKSSTNDASFASAQRKFEEMCRRVNGHFRGVPIVRPSCIDGCHLDDGATDLWCPGTWNTCNVYLHRVKRSASQADNRLSNEIDILTTLRQPNMLLLMGLCYTREQSVTLIFEECVGSLHDIIHKQNRILSAKMSVRFVRDVTNALLFLNMHEKVHRCVSSHCIMLTPSDVAKLANFARCSPISKAKDSESPYRAADIEFSKQKGNTYEAPLEFLPLLSQSESVMSLRADHENQTNSPKATSKVDEAGEEDDKTRQSELGECYKWQAPELFRSGAKLCEKCDVFSVCLVLWECCKLTLPWVNLDYRKLKDLYLKYGTGINVSEDDKCPDCIVEILEAGLKLNPSERISLKGLMDRLQSAKNILESEEICLYKADTENTYFDDNQVTVSDEPWHLQLEEEANSTFHEAIQRLSITDVTNAEPSEERIERLPIFLKNIERYEVTDLDDCNSDAEYPKYSPLKDSSSAASPATPPSHLQRTDSTEYCSLLSPDLRQRESCTRPHLDSPAESRVARLSQSFAPKSYTPLHIRLPSVGTLEGLKQLTRGGDSANKLDAERRYRFEIKNSSMPETPIARSNKLRKNAWLSGESEEVQNRFNNVAAKRRHSDIPFVMQHDESNDVENQTKPPQTDSDNSDATECSDIRKKLMPMRSRTLFRQFSEDQGDEQKEEDAIPSENNTITIKSLSSRNLLKSPLALESNLDRFRSRSQSWTCRRSNPGTRGRHTEDEVLSRVNVKPLVAIHEKWILEARQRGSRSHSLPDADRDSSNPVKPASHRLDPIWPRSLNRSQTYTPKSFNRSQNDVDLSDRCSELSCELKEVLARRREHPPKESDYYESALWRKEKDICADSMPKLDIQDCSTPIRGVHKSARKTGDMQIVDSSTNTSTFEELYERIKGEILNALGANDLPEPPSWADDGDAGAFDDTVKCTGSSILLEAKTSDCNGDAATGNFLSKTAVAVDAACDCSRDDDAVSLPEQFSSDQNDEFTHKTLKRCQAFTALQEARSTEDLYIDDELTHPDNMETLGDNMKLIPLHGSLHEALCDKYEDCCLIRIQEETDCSHMYIVCDKTGEGARGGDRFGARTTFDDKRQTSGEFDSPRRCLQTSVEALPVIVEESERDSNCNDEDAEPVSSLGNFNLREMFESVQNKMAEDSAGKLEGDINILSDFVNLFAAPDTREPEAPLLMVEDLEEMLNDSRPNEGYAELCHEDEIETRTLIDSDGKAVSFCND